MKDIYIHNHRLNRVKLKKYLQKRYNAKLANKLCYLFDWSNHHNYKTFYQAVDELFICNQTNTVDLNQHMICLKQIAFFLFDMNSDSNVCEYDLFSSVRYLNDKMYIGCLNIDIKDIRSRMDEKKFLLNKQKDDIGIKEDDNTF